MMPPRPLLLAWYAEFMLKIDLKILIRKLRARLNMEIKP
jgi:hypothetical protein